VEWLRRLPDVIAACRERWSLTLGEPYRYPSLSYVCPATLPDGTQAVLKASFLSQEQPHEAAALRAFAGNGACLLLDADLQMGALLLERLSPGTQLASLADDERATHTAAAVMRHLWRPAPSQHPFPTVDEWCGGLRNMKAVFGGGTGPIPRRLVDYAEGLAGELLASAPAPMLLHGDLQHYNILSAERQPWLAIDPKGVVGDPGYEVGPYLLNRLDGAADPKRRLARRLHQLAEELGIDRGRLRSWGLVQAVLAAWWQVEDIDEAWEDAVGVAELLHDLP